MNTVTMTHPDLPDQPIESPPTSVPGREASGWTVANVDDQSADEPLAVLRAQAEALDITVDPRWREARLTTEIETAAAAITD